MDGPTSRPGGRTARVRAAVLAAVVADLEEHGLEGLGVDGVAARSGVHRATVFRRWGDVGGLLADVLDAAADDAWTPPDHGSLAADLEDLAQEVLRYVGPAGSTVRALMGAAERFPRAQAGVHRFLDDRYRRSAVVVERAVARGEVDASVEPRRVLVAALGPLYHHLLHLPDPPDAADAAAYVRLVVAGITAPGGRPPRG
ncbi:TetR-like C-terminal domain-containing protein [Actinomycetospora soli]|uniref:TetR-like C-terminal domain-containing protein n=1 Tax=Actinomycetospora soli TaxID=2893887 RepID=UPI001E340B82|nr:TetR-like C-terminal domain-containing protein [Actinomycetospora soli]MCD2190316.1 TetR/AcrR family transcriptional regulator C-terminal ligand-binding domain-containing protein [Actinomycetospora soli]